MRYSKKPNAALGALLHKRGLPPDAETDLLLTDTKEAAEYLEVSVAEVRRMVRAGKLSPLLMNPQNPNWWRFRLDDLEEWRHRKR